MFNRDGFIMDCDRQLQLLSDVLWKVHPGCKYVMKEWFDHVQQWRMATRERRIEVEVLCGIKKDVAKVRIAMPDDSHGGLGWIEDNVSAINQFAQGLLLGNPVDDPVI